MKRWQKVLASGVLLAGGCTTGLYMYAEQLDDEHEMLVADQVEIMVRGDDGRYRAEMVPRKFLPPNPILASEASLHGFKVTADSPIETNPVVSTSEDRFSTFAIDVDTASYTRAKRTLENGFLPNPSEVRVEEFLNYFRYSYAPPTDGAFSVHFDGAPSPFDTTGKKHLVRVGLQGKRVDAKTRKPIHLTLLVDVSGSMNSEDKLGLSKRALGHLVDNLEETDTIAVATYAGRTEKLLGPTSAKRSAEIKSVINSLGAGGGTAMNDGLQLAYDMAMESFVAGHENRVVVLSDGDANLGPSSHQAMLDRIQNYVDEGVTLSTIGFGTGNYRDQAMEQLANNGNGNNYYIASMDDARRVFGDDLGATLVTIAKDVKIQVEFDPAKVKSYRLIGYENRAIADQDFRDDAVDAGEIGAGHSVTALYEIELSADARGELATVRIRHKQPQGRTASELSFALTGEDLADRLDDGSTDLRFAAGVAAFAELLRQSPHASHLSFAAVEEVIAPTIGSDGDRATFAGLIERARTASDGYRPGATSVLSR